MNAINAVFETYNPGDPVHDRALAEIIEWSEQVGSMNTITWERVARFALIRIGIDRFTGEPLTHAAIEQDEETPEGVAKIVSHVVNPKTRGQGLGSASLEDVVRSAPTLVRGIETLQLNVNPKAVTRLEALGGQFMREREGEVATRCTCVVEIAAPIVARSVAC